jgi:hypothetical protein
VANRASRALNGTTETWQIGKRVKRILDAHSELPKAKQLDAFFLWGTALARLASLNEDPTLAEAAADKFQQMHALSDGDEAAFGPVGFTLWASSLLIVATETSDRDALDRALAKFEVIATVASAADERDRMTDMMWMVCVMWYGSKRLKWTAARRSSRGSSWPRRSRRAATCCARLKRAADRRSLTSTISEYATRTGIRLVAHQCDLTRLCHYVSGAQGVRCPGGYLRA